MFDFDVMFILFWSMFWVHFHFIWQYGLYCGWLPVLFVTFDLNINHNATEVPY